MLGFAGCAGKADQEKPSNDGTTEPVPTEQSYQVTLYFANEEYMASGDESLEKFKTYEKEVTAEPDKVFLATLELLRTAPEDGFGTVISEDIQFNDVYTEGDTAFVDLNSKGLSGGSLEETFLIGQIVNTLLNSFEEVKQVQFLVDGQTAETLMGHVGTADPFTKDLFAE
jgi:spore germination protein GerM